MKKLIVIAFIFISGVPFSCNDDIKTRKGVYKIGSIELGVGKISKHNSRYMLEEVVFDDVTPDTISATEFGIMLWYEELDFEPLDQAFRLDFSFISAAFADPAPPSPDAIISSLSIFSEDSVGSGGVVYSAGENLSILFKASSEYGAEPVSFEDFIEEEKKWYQFESIFIHLSRPLDFPMSQKITVRVMMDDGEVFNVESPKVQVK
ncbi:MAG: hypothetical protein JXR03_13400 [Cyclobacteriaceae bacterium]